MGLSVFEIDVDAVGRGKITVDGADVSASVAAFQVTSRPGEVVSVVLHQQPGATRIAGEGVVRVVDESPVDEAAVVREWLDMLDGEALEQEVLASFGSLDPPVSNGEAWIRALRRMLDA